MAPVTVQKIARALNILAWIVLIFNYILLYLIPVSVISEGSGLLDGVWNYMSGILSPAEDAVVTAGIFGSLSAWFLVWQDLHAAITTLFLVISGFCTATILQQGRKVLQTILHGEPFSAENAAHIYRAASCCFIIAVAALVRMVAGVFLFQSIRPLTNYNALFVAVFSLAGLLCLVMAALFRQATEMKAENDLII